MAQRACTVVSGVGHTSGREEQDGQRELAAPVPQLPAQPGLPKQGSEVDDLKVGVAALQRPARLARAPRKVYYVIAGSATRRGGEAGCRRGDKVWEKRCERSLVEVVTLRVYGEGAKLISFAGAILVQPARAASFWATRQTHVTKKSLPSVPE